jgi:hypothetical protein
MFEWIMFVVLWLMTGFVAARYGCYKQHKKHISNDCRIGWVFLSLFGPITMAAIWVVLVVDKRGEN